MRKDSKQFFSNVSWIIGGKIFNMILQFMVSLATARYLGPSNYGLLNYIMSIVAFVLPVMKLGITSILVQEFISEPEKEGETLGTSLVLCFISAIVCIIGVNLFVRLSNAGEYDTIIVCALYSSILIFQVLATAIWK